MQRESLKSVLGRPAFHVLSAVCFAVVFFFPIFAMTRPSQVFHTLYIGWFVCLGVMFAISRGTEPSAESDADADTDESSTAKSVHPTGGSH